eukprot:2842810-Pleurochrysis_carterae.AAC.4
MCALASALVHGSVPSSVCDCAGAYSTSDICSCFLPSSIGTDECKARPADDLLTTFASTRRSKIDALEKSEDARDDAQPHDDVVEHGHLKEMSQQEKDAAKASLHREVTFPARSHLPSSLLFTARLE